MRVETTIRQSGGAGESECKLRCNYWGSKYSIVVLQIVRCVDAGVIYGSITIGSCQEFVTCAGCECFD